jgi:hypothetical protein
MGEDRIENGTKASGSVACHVWAREEDGVAALPTPQRFDCLGNRFSSIQCITREVFAHFQNTLLGRLPSDLRSLVPGTRCSLQVFFPAHDPRHLFSCEEALDVVGSLPARAPENAGNNAGIMRGAQHVG